VLAYYQDHKDKIESEFAGDEMRTSGTKTARPRPSPNATGDSGRPIPATDADINGTLEALLRRRILSSPPRHG